MGRDDEKGVADDGGWGEMVDHGHDLAEYMLDTPHPYDLHGHKPADRWGTRQQLVSERFADPASLADEGRLIPDRMIVSSGRARPPRTPSNTRPSRPAECPAPAAPTGPPSGSLGAMTLLGTTPFPDNTKGRKSAARAAAAARELDMGAEDVVAIVRCGLPAKKIADILRLPLERIKVVGRAYRDAGPATATTAASQTGKPKPARAKPTAGKKKAGKSPLASGGSGRSRPVVGTHPPAVVQQPKVILAIPRCGSCGGPIGFNGRCQCS